MRIIIQSVLVAFVLISITYTAERKIRYISVERPTVNFNPKYLSYMNMTSRRFGRQNPVYYVDIHFNSLAYFGNNISIVMYFYKDLYNGHRRLMMERPNKFCDFLIKDQFFGPPMRQGKLLGSCPYKPGEYHMYNMTIPFDAIPPNFPYFSGKICTNITKIDTKEFVASASIEMNVKTMKVTIS